MNISLYLIMKIFVLWAILFLIQVPVRKKRIRILGVLIFLIKAYMILQTAYLFVVVVNPFTYQNGELLVALYIVLIGDVAACAVVYIVNRIRSFKNKEADRKTGTLKWLLLLSAIFSCCVLLYGSWNMSVIKKNTHMWTAKALSREHTFAFAADIHAGKARTPESLRKLCSDINAEHPEFVILGGDITDEHTSYDDMIAAYKVLSELEAPTYFIYGNHDRQPDSDMVGGRTYSDDQLVKAIQDAGIEILSDEYVKIDDDLVLLGREDLSMGEARLPWSSLKNPYEGSGALIVADHQPYDNEQLSQENAALQISGHTHAGQLWPLQRVYRLAGRQAYGEFIEPETQLYVSAGVGVWMIPLRTEEHCAWELVVLTN